MRTFIMNATPLRIRVIKNTVNSKNRQTLGLATLLFVILISVAAGAASQPVEILTFQYPHYINGDGTGMAEKIVAAAFQTQGHSVKFTLYPPKRSINNFQKGEGKMFLGVRDYFPKREINAEEIFYFRRVLVYLKDQYPELQINSLDGHFLGPLCAAHAAANANVRSQISPTYLENWFPTYSQYITS
jgi:hypothetical protein